MEDELAQEQLFLASRAQKRIDTLLEHHGLATDTATYREIHQRILREERIGLFGEPLAGVQIMGMLEPRALDIERILLLSAEEGTLPPSSSDRSFIPFELRRGHGLPLRHRQDAVSAYHFLRAIQRGNRLRSACSTSEGSWVTAASPCSWNTSSCHCQALPWSIAVSRHPCPSQRSERGGRTR